MSNKHDRHDSPTAKADAGHSSDATESLSRDHKVEDSSADLSLADAVDQTKKTKKRITITTSAVTGSVPNDPPTQSEDTQTEGGVDSPKSHTRAQKIPAPWSKDEPLTQIHSLLGHMAQGDVYRNELGLIYERIQGEADTPEFIPVAVESELDTSAMHEPILGSGSGSVGAGADIEISGESSEPFDPFSGDLFSGEPLPDSANARDTFAGDGFQFAMSVGEVSIEEGSGEKRESEESEESEESAKGDAALTESNAAEVFERLDLEELKQQYQTTRRGVDSDDETIIETGSPKAQAELTVEDALLAQLSDSPAEWEEAALDPLEVTREPRRHRPQFFQHQDEMVRAFKVEGDDETPEGETGRWRRDRALKERQGTERETGR